MENAGHLRRGIESVFRILVLVENDSPLRALPSERETGFANRARASVSDDVGSAAAKQAVLSR